MLALFYESIVILLVYQYCLDQEKHTNIKSYQNANTYIIKSNQYCLVMPACDLFCLFCLKAQEARDVAMTSSVGLLGILGPVGSSAISHPLFLLFIILTDDDPDISIVYNP